MSKYYEVVDISQKPDKAGLYFVAIHNPGTDEDFISIDSFKEGKWECSHIKSWLREIDQIPLSREQADPSVLVEAAKIVIDRMFWTYKARNGREMSIEDSHGEKCWIVPDEAIELLKEALTTYKESKPSQSITREQAEKIWDAAVLWCNYDGEVMDGSVIRGKEEYLKQFDKQ